MRGSRRGWWCALAACVLGGAACAQQTVDPTPAQPGGAAPEPRPGEIAGDDLGDDPQGIRPEGSGRVVRVFGFDGVPGPGIPLSEGWFRGQDDPSIPRERPGFPVWNGAVVDTVSPAFRGAGSVRLPTGGGSTSVMLRPGLAAVFPRADYRVSARVRTEGLLHASAALEARLLDQSGAVIPGTSVRSRLVQPRGEWAEVRVDLLGEHAEAAFLQIELLLLQPREQTDRPSRGHEVWEQDYSGSAWFDEVTITQLPRMDLSTQHAAQLVRAPERPTLLLRVRDLAGEDLLAQWRVLDANGEVVARLDSGPFTGRLETAWTPELPELGWYRAEVRLLGPTGEASRVSCALGWLPARAEGPATDGLTAARQPAVLGVETSSGDGRVIDALPAVAASIDARAATIPVWPAELGVSAAAWTARIAGAVDATLLLGVDTTLSFDRAPSSIVTSAAMADDDGLSLLAAPERAWEAEAMPALDRFGQRVRRWRAGPAGGGEGLWVPDAPARATLATEALGRLVPGPSVTVPWRSDADLPTGLARPGRATSVLLGPGVGEAGAAEVVRRWLADAEAADPAEMARALDPTDLPRLEVSLAADAQAVGGPRAAAAMAVRTAVAARLAWDEGPNAGTRMALLLGDGWTLTDARRPVAQPTAELTAWASLAERLEGRRAESIDLGAGVSAVLLTPRDAGTEQRGAIAWWRSGIEAPEELFVPLGDGALEVVDLFGNRAPAARAPDDSPTPGAAVLAVGDEPAFVEGVDAALVRLLASVRLEPGVLRSRAEPQAHRVEFLNPFGAPIRGRLTVLEPGGYSVPGGRIDRSWRVDPRTMAFVLGVGETASLPLEIEFSPAEESGPKRFVLEVELAGRSAPMRVVRTVELGLPELDLRVGLRPAPEGAGGVAVVAEVTNLGAMTRDLDLIAIAPGVARERVGVTGLRPGETATRLFIIRGTPESLRGTRVSVGVLAADNDERLNKSVVID